MNFQHCLRCLFVCILGLWVTPVVVNGADLPFVHGLFTDNAIMQREVRFPVWGWTTPGAVVEVSMAGVTNKAIAGPDGKWIARLGPFPAGGPHTMMITGPHNLVLKNILVGDVWLCSGQSNMQMGLGEVTNGRTEVANANFPQIRLFNVSRTMSPLPCLNVKSEWHECNPDSVSRLGTPEWGGFSALAYFFGREIHKELGIPIGLINASVGGTIIEAWSGERALRRAGGFDEVLDSMQVNIDQWYAKHDVGSAGGIAWSKPNLDVSNWETMDLPKYWEGAGHSNFDGIGWYRKDITLPQEWAGKDLVLSLGEIDDEDTTWFNGEFIGSTNAWNAKRVYQVPGKCVKAGVNTIAVRVFDNGDGGGFYGNSESMKLELAGEAAGTNFIALAGPWRYRLTVQLSKSFQRPKPFVKDENPNRPTLLHNGMIAPLEPFAIKGALWYQAESNTDNPNQYATLLREMIADWRAGFGVGDFPFLIVQLPNIWKVLDHPSEAAWADLREAQLQVSQSVTNCGLAVTADIGDPDNIHPPRKLEVAKRLSLAALAKVYGKRIEYSGPIYRQMVREGNRIRLKFDHVGEGLAIVDGDKLRSFAIAGKDAKFVWAQAVLDGADVVAWADQIAEPVSVRYGWAASPNGNLYNKAGLPASPFRTDSPIKAAK